MEDVEGYGYLIDLIVKGSLAFYKIMIIVAIVILILSIICIVAHIFGARGLSKIAKDRSENYSTIAWVPQANNLIISKIAFNNYYVGIAMICCALIQLVFIDNACSYLDLIIWIIYCVLFINFSSPFIILYYVLSFVCAFNIYRQYTKNYIALTIVSILTLNLTTPFIYFKLRNKPLINRI
jgi:hypothetical protein